MTYRHGVVKAPAGEITSVRTEFADVRPEQRANAIQILSASALELEEAEGVMANGQWTDFNPLKPVTTVD